MTASRSLLGMRSLVLSRTYSTAAPADINHKNIQVTRTSKSRLSERPPNDKLAFGRTFSDHMLSIEYVSDKGWLAPQIKPYGPLSIDPAALCLHYAIECFEGMKAYIDAQGNARLFRPRLNMERLNSSCTRICMPGFNPDEGVESLKELIRIDKDWIPKGKGYSLYIRPTMIGTQAVLGVTASNQALLYVITCPVGPYYPSGFEPVRLLAEPNYVRAWPGGMGNYKVGGNYAPGILPARQASQKGFQQLLWLFGPEHHITEVGTMNMFVLWTNEEGVKELITPPLDGTILPGVTRRSVLELTRSWGEFKVSEKPFTMGQLLKAQKEDRLLEAFGVGTACIVSPIKEVSYLGKEYSIPLDKSNPSAKAGPLANRLYDTILAIQYGELEHEGWSVKI